jgi:hypothetical protein
VFADLYFSKKGEGRNLIEIPPHPETGMIIVIPCFHEPEIIKTLESLQKCRLPENPVEVIILINQSENSSEEVKKFNLETFSILKDWVKKLPLGKVDYYPVGPVELPQKWAGVGLARKNGMDEATARFNSLSKPEGVIVSLDADTLVKENYLVEIEKYFEQNHKHVGATIAFNHQKTDLSDLELNGIELYELYLKYYKNALSFTGYPFAMFTIGSAFAVRAEAYVRRGGMNRRKAGEDFYFLQGLVQVGDVGEITSTEVYPSARQSERVPFGTGASMKKWLKGTEDLTQTYSFQAFIDLKKFFDLVEQYFRISENNFQKIVAILPEPVVSFLKEDVFFNQLDDLNQNCSSSTVFKRRFFHLFNAFKILKFLNYSHPEFYQQVSLAEQVRLLNEYSEGK